MSFIVKRGYLIWNGRRKKGIYRSYIHILSQYHYMGVPPPGIIGYTLVDEEFCICSFVSPPHTSNGFQADINWPLLAAADVSS